MDNTNRARMSGFRISLEHKLTNVFTMDKGGEATPEGTQKKPRTTQREAKKATGYVLLCRSGSRERARFVKGEAENSFTHKYIRKHR